MAVEKGVDCVSYALGAVAERSESRCSARVVTEESK